MKRFFLLICLCAPFVGTTQSDLDYSFFTNGQSLVSIADTVIEMYLPTQIIKQSDELLIRSTVNTSDIRYRDQLTFIGLRGNRQLLYRGKSSDTLVSIDPIAGVVVVKKNNILVFKFGASFLHEYD